jgi:hypothetical protein
MLRLGIIWCTIDVAIRQEEVKVSQRSFGGQIQLSKDVPQCRTGAFTSLHCLAMTYPVVPFRQSRGADPSAHSSIRALLITIMFDLHPTTHGRSDIAPRFKLL